MARPCPSTPPTRDADPQNCLQGFASGDCDRDAQAIRIFAEDGHRMMLCQVGGG